VKTDVVVVGAGLAGLSAAIHLTRAGVEVVLLDADERVGGRVKTDAVDGFLLDRGFQVFNTAYPEPRRLIDFDALQLHDFLPGAAVASERKLRLVANPLRRPEAAWSTLSAPFGSLAQKSRMARLSAGDALLSAQRRHQGPDTTTAEALRQAGLSGPLVDRVLRPFLAGVLLDADLETSARFFHLVWRSFARGRPCLPAGGMGAIPTYLRGLLGPRCEVRLGTEVGAVDTTGVTIEGEGRLDANAVVVATDPATAARLIPALPSVPMRSLTTFYHRAPTAPLEQPILVLGGPEGPVVNSVVLTEVCSLYGPGDQALVSSTILGAHTDADTERMVRSQLAELYGTDTSGWSLVRTYAIPDALPAFAVGQSLRQSVRVEPGLYVCGDHRDTPSIQGAMVSGRRAARAILADRSHP
jgi:phytoene dehydrogenase-like protein